MGAILRVKDKDGIVHEIPAIKGDKGDPGPALAVSNTAAVGQTVRITAVDENGQPTEWEAVDMASGSGEGYIDTVLFEITTTEEVSLIQSANFSELGIMERLFLDDLIFIKADIVPPADESYTSNGSLSSLSIFHSGGFAVMPFLSNNTANIVPKYGSGYNGYVDLLLFPISPISGYRKEIGQYKTGQYSIATVNTEVNAMSFSANDANKLSFRMSTSTVFGLGTTLKIVSRRYL